MRSELDLDGGQRAISRLAGPGLDRDARLCEGLRFTDAAIEDTLATQRLADRLAEGDTGAPEAGRDAEVTFHPVLEHLEVQLAHAGEDELAGLLVRVAAEGRVLALQPVDDVEELLSVGGGAGLDGDGHDRLREGDLLEQERAVGVGQCVPGLDVLERGGRDDVPTLGAVDGLLLVGVEPKQASQP